jgi:hypothetical protein
MMPDREPGANQADGFIPGLQLSRLFYAEAVRPILAARFPGLPHSAALIGPGSEVLGFDTPMSTDHEWGPRLLLFVPPEDERAKAISQALVSELPRQFRGYPASFSPPNPADNGTRQLEPDSAGPVNHRVRITTIERFFREYLALEIGKPMAAADWLVLPQHRLLAVTAGALHHDDLGLQTIRDRLAFYPHDVWLYLLAAGWNRIAQEEHLMGRAGFVGDELGAAIIGSRLCRDIMRLCFLMERQYAPYPKWLGSAFARLASGPDLAPVLLAVQTAGTWQERERHLCTAFEYAARIHNALDITDLLPTEAAPFFNRPFRVIHLGGGFAGEIAARISDPAVRRIADRRLIGSIDQFTDSTDLDDPPRWSPVLRQLYE